MMPSRYFHSRDKNESGITFKYHDDIVGIYHFKLNMLPVYRTQY